MIKLKETGHKLLSSVAAAALWFGVSMPAGASLINDTINITTNCGFACLATDNNVFVSAGLELSRGDASSHDLNFFANAGDSIDVSAAAVRFTFGPDIAFGGGSFFFISTFTGLDWVGHPNVVGITAATIVAANGVLQAGAQANALPGGSSFDFQGTVITQSNQAVFFDVLLTVDHTPVAVPEPGTLPLLAVSLLGVACAARRKRRHA